MQNSLIIFSGLPGTGKSTLASRLARELQFPLLCIDDVAVEVPENAGVEFWDSQVAILLDRTEAQLKLDTGVIVDSVFMNTDRHHAQELARKYRARFLPIHVFVSDETIWKERVTTRFNEANTPDVAAWERIQHQRKGFLAWQAGTALFINSLHSPDANYAKVLDFVLREDADLRPLEEVPLFPGRYHE